MSRATAQVMPPLASPPWPRPGTPLLLRMACCGGLAHTSIVDDVSSAGILVGAPLHHPGPRDLPERGELVQVGWVGATAWLELDGILVGREAPGSWRLAVPGPVRRIQRRAFARCREARPVVLGLGEGRMAKGTVVDLGEGGLRITLPPPGLEVGITVTVGFDLDGERLWLEAVVVRAGPCSEGLAELGLHFADLDTQRADRIRRHVFARQAHDRALGLGLI